MQIKAIGFDWGGVILQTPGPSFNEAAATFLGVEKDVFRRAYFLHNHMVNKGENMKDYDEAIEMWSAILSEIGKLDALEGFMGFVKNRPKGLVSLEMIELLKLLRLKGWKLGLFSNNSIEAAEEFRRHGYDQYFDATLFSAEVDCMKPEPEAFMKLATALNVSVSELVFIDDSERSLSTAVEVGYIPVLFKSKASLVDQLASLGIVI
jgi:putative hydrolase of the HAD superfamily